jgi:hypothetical protein
VSRYFIDKISLRIFHTTLLCRFDINVWICCCLHLSSTCSHVYASNELHMWHVFDGCASLPKKSCFRAWPMYCPVQNLTRYVFCLSVTLGFVQKLFDNVNILSISLFSSHLCSWCV